MTDNQAFAELEKEKLAEEVKAKALEGIEKAKSDLIESLQGKQPKFSWEEQGRDKPANYDELFDEVGKRVIKPEDVKSIVAEELKAKEEAELKKQEDERVQQAKTLEQKKEEFEREWGELVNDGKLPNIADNLWEKINAKEKLTEDEIKNDPGIQARVRLAELVTSTSKTPKLAYYEEYTKQHAGASAPVFGSRPTPPSQQNTEEFTPEDIESDRKRIFGF